MNKLGPIKGEKIFLTDRVSNYWKSLLGKYADEIIEQAYNDVDAFKKGTLK